MKTLYFLLAVGISSIFGDMPENWITRHSITYEGGSRFGDRMLVYGQARYLSYMTSVPFLWRPFPYSEYLTIDFEARSYDPFASQHSQIFHINSAKSLCEFYRKIRDPNTPPTLFIVDYFPSDISEWDRDASWNLCFDIPWHEEKFANYFRSSCLPKLPIPDLRKEGYLNVADHVRTWSGGDNKIGFPLKQGNLAYHCNQIRRVYEYNLRRPMHVFLFTDTKEPLKLLEEFCNSFTEDNIIFGVQTLENVDIDFVIQDFFAMQKFDVLIATQSGFSMMAHRVGSFDMVIFPVHHSGKSHDSELLLPWEIDRVQVISKKSSWFPYDMNAIIKEK